MSVFSTEPFFNDFFANTKESQQVEINNLESFGMTK